MMFRMAVDFDAPSEAQAEHLNSLLMIYLRQVMRTQRTDDGGPADRSLTNHGVRPLGQVKPE
jgi:hypothetical protein